MRRKEGAAGWQVEKTAVFCMRGKTLSIVGG